MDFVCRKGRKGWQSCWLADLKWHMREREPWAEWPKVKRPHLSSPVFCSTFLSGSARASLSCWGSSASQEARTRREWKVQLFNQLGTTDDENIQAHSVLFFMPPIIAQVQLVCKEEKANLAALLSTLIHTHRETETHEMRSPWTSVRKRSLIVAAHAEIYAWHLQMSAPSIKLLFYIGV